MDGRGMSLLRWTVVVGLAYLHRVEARRDIDPTAIGTMYNAIAQIPALPFTNGKAFRPPCKEGELCYKTVRRLMVPKLAQLENTIMGIMKEMAAMPPGSRVPEKITKTEPLRLMLDGNYKEPMCESDAENCAQEDRRRRRILKKLFLKKYSNMRALLIAYGGRQLWGGDANLFYR